LLAGGGSTPTQIVNGTSNVVVASSGNVTVGITGTAAVAIFTTAGMVANSVSATNNGAGTNFKVGDDAWIGDVNNADTISIRGQQNAANGYIVFGNADSTTTLGRAGSGPLTYGGAFSATGNITGNYFIGNGSQLTGIASGSSSNINNGTSNVTVVSSGGNVTVGVGGTSNVAVFATTGEYVTGLISATGNITGGNILTGGLISATGNITGGNLLGPHANGTSNININTAGGNIAFSVGGTANVVVLNSSGWTYADTTAQNTGINLGRIQTSVQGWNLP
jgi:hypothetical protein